jgi:hypothetical protein
VTHVDDLTLAKTGTVAVRQFALSDHHYGKQRKAWGGSRATQTTKTVIPQSSGSRNVKAAFMKPTKVSDIFSARDPGGSPLRSDQMVVKVHSGTGQQRLVVGRRHWHTESEAACLRFQIVGGMYGAELTNAPGYPGKEGQNISRRALRQGTRQKMPCIILVVPGRVRTDISTCRRGVGWAKRMFFTPLVMTDDKRLGPGSIQDDRKGDSDKEEGSTPGRRSNGRN